MPVRKRALGSNLAKVDAHRITKEEYDEIPELTDEWFSRAIPHIGGKRASRAHFRKAVAKAMGRPRLDNPKQSVTLRLDADVVEHFRGSGRGWQTRINETLRRVAHLSAPKKGEPIKRLSAKAVSRKRQRRGTSTGLRKLRG
jgi:uncharacterized protein (DUF4415 family)